MSERAVYCFKKKYCYKGRNYVLLDFHGFTFEHAWAVFRDTYNEAILGRENGPVDRLDIIHGGRMAGEDGVLRKQFRCRFERLRKKGNLWYRPGERDDRNPGHTLVTPIKPLAK